MTREPLAIRAAIVAAIAAVLHALVVLGVLPIDPDAEAAIAGAVDLVGLAVVVAWTRPKITPVEAPALTVEQAESTTIVNGPPTASVTVSTPGEAFNLANGDDDGDLPGRHEALPS